MSGAAQAQPDFNFLVGGSFGYAVRTGDVTTEMDYRNPAREPGAFLTHTKNLFKDNGTIWGVLAGGQLRCSDWLLGLELGYDRHNLDEAHQQPFADRIGFVPVISQGWLASSRYEVGDVLSLSLRWGYVITKYLLPYIRIGAETSKDKLTVNYIGVNNYPYTLTNLHEKRTYRFLGGLGFEVPLISEKLKFRGEYSFHVEGKPLHAEGFIIDGVRDPNFINEARPRTHAIKAAIVWNVG
tara:strand:+ start:94971 stop:95687 length:717 start_codon:yes stop_codon:yes gene_type:complete